MISERRRNSAPPRSAVWPKAGATRVGEHQHPDQDDAGEVGRVEDDRGGVVAVVAEHLAAERDQHDPGEVEEVEAEQPAVEAGHFGEEAVMDDPEAADHREAERVGEEVLALVPEDVAEVVAMEVLGDAEVEDQQRDRDREDAVAEGDDPRELDLVLLPPLRAGLAIPDLAATSRLILEWSAPAGVAQLVEHFTRNEGVPGSNPGVGLTRACPGCRWRRRRGGP